MLGAPSVARLRGPRPPLAIHGPGGLRNPLRIRPGTLLLALALAGCGAPQATSSTGMVPPPAPPVPAGVAPAAPVPAPPGASAARRPVSFDFRATPFRSAVRTLSRLGAVPLRWDPRVPPAVLETPVTLRVDGMPLEAACAWLGRLVDLQVEAQEAGTLCFVPFALAVPEQGGWALTQVPLGALVTPPPPPSVMVRRVGSYDRVVGHPALPAALPEPAPGGKPGRARLGSAGPDPVPGMLAELDQVLDQRHQEDARTRQQAVQALIETLRPLASTSYDHSRFAYLLPGSPDLLVVDQPVSGPPWVLDAIRLLASHAPSSAPPPDAEDDAMSDRLSSVSVALPAAEMETSEAIRLLAREGGVSLGWDPRELAGAVLRRVRLPGGRMTLAAALRILVQSAGFVRMHREPGAGIWLVGPREASTALRQRFLQDDALAAYPIADLDAAVGAGTVQGVLRSRLEAGVWEEPGAVLSYHAPTRQLLVRHRPEVHQGVRALLDLLRRDGAAPFQTGGTKAP